MEITFGFSKNWDKTAGGIIVGVGGIGVRVGTGVCVGKAVFVEVAGIEVAAGEQAAKIQIDTNRIITNFLIFIFPP
jgi:malic enzyme